MHPSDSHEAQYDDELRFRAKRELRKRMRSLRAALPPRAIAERSAAIVQRVRNHPAWEAARTVAMFMSMPDEVQLGDLIDLAHTTGKCVALPVVTDAPVLTFRAHAAAAPLVASAFGVLEPDESAPVVALGAIDLVVVPALAVDPRGHRIGYGRGYYDHTLATAHHAETLVVAFDFQLIAEVPTRAGDVAARWIITDRRTMPAEP